MKIFRPKSRSQLLLLTLLSLLFLLLGCSKGVVNDTINSLNQEKNGNGINGNQRVEKNDTAEQEQAVEALTTPRTLEERFSYTYGYLLMATAARDVQEIDVKYFAKGVLDAGLENEPLIPSFSMNSVLFEYQEKLMLEAAKRQEELAKKNLEDAESFLAINGQREGVITTESGLQYEIIRNSEGTQVKEHDIVKVNYRLTYLDGREGDSSIRGIPSTFNLDSLIVGFREGLMLMRTGAEFRFFVHPSLGYGSQGSTRIEPNTLLIFDVELVEIVEPTN